MPPITISKPFQTSVTEPLQASLIALNLLSVLILRIWNSRAQRSSVSFTEIDYVWTLDSISHLWTTLERLRRTTVFSERLANICLTILRLFRNHLRQPKPLKFRTTDDKAALVLIRISASLLRWPRHDLTTLLESELCSVFVDILGLSERSNTTSEAITGFLLPPTLGLVTDGGLTALSQDMQVRGSLWCIINAGCWLKTITACISSSSV
jgi:hypothetical protein